jgi:hypothetical protein
MQHYVLWAEWFKANVLLLVDMAVLAVGGLVVVGLLGFHTFLMLRGLTTWEAASRERITYLRSGFIENIANIENIFIVQKRIFFFQTAAGKETLKT